MKKVFISYSWDSPEHLLSIFELSNRLRNDGVDCDIDQYHQSPVEGWPRWMERLTRESDYVLVICTQNYLDGFEGRRPPKVGQGVKWESLLTTNDIYYNDSKNKKYIPVILEGADRQSIPRPLESFTHFDLSSEEGYEGLYRLITGQPSKVKPPLGEERVLSTDNDQPLTAKKNAWEREALEKNHHHQSAKDNKQVEDKKKSSFITTLFFILGGIATISGVLHFFNQPDNVKDLGDKFLNKPVPMANEKLTVIPRFADLSKSENRQLSLYIEDDEVREKCNSRIGKKGEKLVFFIYCTKSFDDLIRFTVIARDCDPVSRKGRLGFETTTPAIVCN